MYRTCIQGLTQQVVVCISLLIIREYFISLLVNVLHDFTQAFILGHPYLSCSLFNSRITVVPFLLSYLMLVLSRMGLLLFTMRFQTLNHELIVHICTAMTVGITLLDLVLSSTLSTIPYCNTMRRFSRRNHFNVNEIIPTTDPTVGLIAFLIISILATETTYQVIFNYREYKSNKVSPGPVQVLKPRCTIRPQTSRSNNLPPPLSLVTVDTSLARRSSYPNEGPQRTQLHRKSLDSHWAISGQNGRERLSLRLIVNGWMEESTGTAAETRNPTQEAGVNVSNHSPIHENTVEEGQVQTLALAQKRTKFHSLTLLVFPCAFLFLIMRSLQTPEHLSMFQIYVLDPSFTVFVRVSLYFIPLYWVLELTEY